MLESISCYDSIGYPILSLVVFLPCIGALFLLFFNSEWIGGIRRFAFGVAIVDFLIALMMLFSFKSGTPAMQFVEKLDWIPSIGASYHIGVDGISVFLVLLTALLGAVTILSTYRAITTQVKEFMICILLLQTTMMGVFVSLDMLLFYLFFEAQLLPMYLIIGIWGSDRRIYSATKMFIYTLVGTFPMVLGLLAVYFNYHDYAIANKLPELFSFDLLTLYNIPIEYTKQLWIFWALFIGFAIKVPMFPVHTWLPDAHTDAPTAGSVVLAGILLKMGSYGFVRFSLPLLPDGVHRFFPVVLMLSGIAILYGVWVAMTQKDMKKLVAYSSISHMGYITMGIFALNSAGITGGVLQMINHGLSTGALFLLVGMLYERRHTRMISEYGGLFKQLPLYTTFFAIAMFSSMGVPGLNGFVGEIMILMGTYNVSSIVAMNVYKAGEIYTVVAVLGILGCAGYLLWLFQRVFLGKVTNPKNKELKDLSGREILTLVPLTVLIFWIGLYPTPFIKRIKPSVDYLVKKKYSLEKLNQPANASAGLLENKGNIVKFANTQEGLNEHSSVMD